MSEQNRDKRATLDAVLDVLLDALEERAEERNGDATQELVAEGQAVAEADSVAVVEEISTTEMDVPHLEPDSEEIDSFPEAIEENLTLALEEEADVFEEELVVLEEEVEQEIDVVEPEFPHLDTDEPMNMNRTIARLFVALLFFIVIANIPINYAELNRLVGVDSTPQINRRVLSEGTLLREDKRVYVIENAQLRWITTSEAFDANEYRWRDVRVVGEGYLDEFPEGAPIDVLIKCRERPEVYILTFDNSRYKRVKRWIPDIATFETLGLVWEDIEFMSCSKVSGYSSGSPIPKLATEP